MDERGEIRSELEGAILGDRSIGREADTKRFAVLSFVDDEITGVAQE